MFRDQEDIVAAFLTKAIPLDTKTTKQETPLALAIRKKATDIVKRLVNAGAKTEIRNEEGNTALHLAAMDDLVDILQILREAGADIHARNNAGETPLHVAARHGAARAARWALAHGANPDDLDKHDRTFIDVAMRAGHLKFVQSFADIETVASSESTPDGENGATVPAASAPPRRTIALKVQDLASDAVDPQSHLLKCFLFGTVKGGAQRRSAQIFDMLLWFVAFPFLLCLVWEAFHVRLISPLITLTTETRKDSIYVVLQSVLNLGLVFFVSHLMIGHGEGNVPFRHFVPNIRRTIYFRLVHFVLLISLFFAGLGIRYTADSVFWLNFAIFWFVYVVIYAIFFLLWWNDTQTD